MAFDTYLRFLLALLLVLGLIVLLAWFLRRFGFGGAMQPNAKRRLQVVETAAIGPRHRLLLVRRDRTEHLLLLGPGGDTVVERGITRPQFDRELAGTEPGQARGAAETEPVRQEPPSPQGGVAPDLSPSHRKEGAA